MRAVDVPFEARDVPDEVIEIGVSAGVGLFPDDGATPAALLLAADAEMYAGKRAQRR